MRAACRWLELLACGPLRASRVFETAPMYIREQPAFFNAVVTFPTRLSPEALLAELLRIEGQCGRVRAERNGPRVIDLDLIDLEGHSRQSEQLALPHPRIAERAFVLVPLLDVLPGWTHPETGVSVSEMLSQLAADASPPRPVGDLLPVLHALREVRG